MSVLFKQLDWANSANIYEVNTRQYTHEGTFAAFAKHLPRLHDMGVEILWFMPITPISLDGRQGSLGSYYAVADYTGINPEYGTLEDFVAVVQQAHSLNMKVIVDWVANHTGKDNAWAKQYPDWYRRDEQGNFMEANGWADVIDLNYSNKDMRKAMIAAMKYWITEANIDGFRCDMAHLVPLDFWQEARIECDELRPMYWLAETDAEEYLQVFDASYAWEWMTDSAALVQHKMGTEKMMSVLLKYATQCEQHSQKLMFTTNHDENSWNGTEYEKYGAAAKAFAVFTNTWRGIPLLYGGQELPNYKRLKFFDKDEIEWTDAQPQLHDFYKSLFMLRRRCNVFNCSAELVYLETGAADKIVAYVCKNANEKALVLFNFSDAERVRFTLSHDDVKDKYQNIFSGLTFQFDKEVSFEMQPWQYIVYEKI